MVGDAAAALDELDALLRGQRDGLALRSLITQSPFGPGGPERAAEILERANGRGPARPAGLVDAWRSPGACSAIRGSNGFATMSGWSWSPKSRRLTAHSARRLCARSRCDARPVARDAVRAGRPVAARRNPNQRRSVRAPGPGNPAVSRGGSRLAAEKAVAGLPDDPGHPFLSRKSLEFGFSGSWSVRLAAGGHHVSHIHPRMDEFGLLRAPAGSRARRPRRRHEGWIQFGVPPENLGSRPAAAAHRRAQSRAGWSCSRPTCGTGRSRSTRATG